jgi:iron complex outermembrane recepter protein
MMKIRQIATLIAFILASTVVAFGQKTIKGTVTDADNKEPLVGAAISIKGTSKGTLADFNGAFSLDVPSGATTLMVSFVGYATKEIAIGTTETLDIQLSTGVALDNVVVLGSRAPGRTNTQSAVPVDVITPKDLKGFSQVDLGQILNYIAPSFNSNRQTVADGTDHVDPASLRGLGPDQVLVLVNGKRRHTSALVNINGTVGRGSVGTDMNVIPVAAIERIEVLRDGAAAQYGSDAIAGVINVVLKKDMDGLAFSSTLGANNTNLKYTAPNIGGTTDSYNKAITDGQVLQFDLMKGFKLGKEGRLMIAAQYSERGKTNRSGIDNAPTNYIGGNGSFPGTPAGLNQDSFRRALLSNDAALSKTNNYDRHNMVFGNSSSKNIGVFANGAIPFDGDAELYFAGGLTHRTGEGYGNYRLAVARNQQPIKADGTLLYPNGFLPGIRSSVDDQSLIVGIKRSLGEWKMDLSNVYGANQFQFEVFNSGNASLPNGTDQTTFDAGKLRFNQNTTNLDFARSYDKMGILGGLSTAFGAELRTDNYQIVAGETNSWYGNGRTVPGAPLVNVGGPANGTAVAAPGAQVFPGYQPSNALDVRRNSVGV